ncbi:hypothetical protein ALO52_200285 [Pseudomonas syringae pv. primulae]|uniref:NADH dehydrogenase I subunit F n=1 Tax=Pseudomonas syringae pv. primulae TaxID=251707 RepID=A0A0Q0DJQ6_9PSED|nr:hypothetical protein ALO52_200285 [Pseudomonas syringae pv. primulae]
MHCQQIAGRIVVVSLCVVNDLIRVGRQVLHAGQRWAVAGIGLDFDPCRFDQLIQRVVPVVPDRLNETTDKRPHPLRRVCNFENIANRVVNVLKVLQRTAIGRGGQQLVQTARLRVIDIATGHAVARCFLLDLIERVVLDVTDERLQGIRLL